MDEGSDGATMPMGSPGRAGAALCGGMAQHRPGWLSTGQGGSAPSREKLLCRSGSEGLLSFSM